MDSIEALAILTRVGAIQNGHYRLVSGRHSNTYIDKDMLYPHTVETSRFCQAIAEKFLYVEMDAVVAPEKGGIILSQWVAYWLSVMKHREILAFYAEKTVQEDFILKRGNAANRLREKRVLLAEDLLTTGSSVRKVAEFLRTHNNTDVVGVGVLCNRGNVTLEALGNPPTLFSVLDLEISSWADSECPLCKSGQKISTVLGHGKKAA